MLLHDVYIVGIGVVVVARLIVGIQILFKSFQGKCVGCVAGYLDSEEAFAIFLHSHHRNKHKTSITILLLL